MTLYAGFVFVLVVLETLFSPYLVGKPRDMNYPIGMMIGFGMLMPIFGRVFGWW